MKSYKKDLLVVIPIVSDNPFFVECLKSLDSQTLEKDRYSLFLSVNNRDRGVLSSIEKRLDEYEFDYKLEYSRVLNSGNARNLGLDYAISKDYKYIVFIDDDDLVSDEYLEGLLNQIENSTYDLVVSNVKFMVGHTVMDHPYAVDYWKKDSTSIYKARRFFNSPWMKIFRVSTILEYRFPQLKRSQDVVFMTRLSSVVQSIGFTGEDAIYYVRKREDSTSRKKQNFFFEFYYRMIVINKYILPLMLKKGYSRKFLLSRAVAQFILIFKNSFGSGV